MDGLNCLPLLALVVSDVVWNALIAGIVTVVLALIARKAERKVAEVKVDLEKATIKTDKKLTNIAKVSESIHTLVNSNMGLQLRISMLALSRVAELTKHVKDIRAAKVAIKAYRAHEAKQKLVDEAVLNTPGGAA